MTEKVQVASALLVGFQVPSHVPGDCPSALKWQGPNSTQDAPPVFVGRNSSDSTAAADGTEPSKDKIANLNTQVVGIVTADAVRVPGYCDIP
eukprot:2129746-Rhodomonas_salina.1